MEPIVISYDNAPNDNTRFFIKTLEQTKWKFRMVGEGDTWEGWPTRMRKYLEEVSVLKEDQLVVFTDARDVFAVRPPNEFTKAFRSFGKQIVVSMELFCEGHLAEEKSKGFQCVPLTNYWKHLGVVEKPERKFVNNGLVAGYAKALKEMLTWILDHKYKDDQLGLGNYMNTFPDLIYADVDAEMFHTSSAGISCCTYKNKVQANDGPTFPELLGCRSFFLHIPGHTISKGQKFMFDLTTDFLKKLNGQKLTTIYNYSPILWNENTIPEY
jgi:hypothetical protein